MLSLLAYAQGQDVSASGLSIILICAGLMILVIGLSVIPLAIARRRNLRAHNLALAMIVWAVLACGSLISASMNQMQFAKDYMTDLQTGYLNPSDMSGAARPWILWIALGIIYGGMIIGSCIWPAAKREEK